MRIFLGILFLVLGVPSLLIALGTMFGHQHFETSALFIGGPFTLLGMYCMFGPD
jgi:hypothetical protein